MNHSGTPQRNIFRVIKSIWVVLRVAIARLGEERAQEGAASVAFFGFFSLFPMMLVMVAIGSTLLASSEAQDRVLEIILQVFPFSGETIEENVVQVLKARGSVSVIGLIGLTWSATGAFNVFTRNINRAWPNTRERNFIKLRLISYGILAVLVGGLTLILLANTLIRLLPTPFGQVVSLASSLKISPRLILWVGLLIALIFIYRWLPNTIVRWKEALWGAMVASLGVQAVTLGFIWYLNSGLSNYNLIYGPLGAVVALLTWIFLVNLIIFFGAHWGAAIAQKDRNLQFK